MRLEYTYKINENLFPLRFLIRYKKYILKNYTIKLKRNVFELKLDQANTINSINLFQLRFSNLKRKNIKKFIGKYN